MEARRRSECFPMMVLFFVGLCGTFQGCFVEAENNGKSAPPAAANRFRSSVVFPIEGNVYPIGLDRDYIEDFSQPYTANFGILEGQCAAR
ncbi:putative Eukaryotic aspartyl protease family protein [Tripterygium wilfordii]|uniref:Putative Eukaryotic aspartyl protease family protein n=1 Tax=Tripterygium wilfordii TaxID=458696 RepID=A0A7J7BUK0_TRIWF|nr:putative Eukaryotic aspartyl protease family protein [Tripterygium wilfordii]